MLLPIVSQVHMDSTRVKDGKKLGPQLYLKAKFNNYKISDYPSFERSRISGKKKVNEFIDGFLILFSIIRLFIFKK